MVYSNIYTELSATSSAYASNASVQYHPFTDHRCTFSVYAKFSVSNVPVGMHSNRTFQSCTRYLTRPTGAVDNEEERRRTAL